MPHRTAAVEHAPVVGQPSAHAEERVIVVLDAETGRRIGHSPHRNVEQVSREKKRGVITTTLKIRPLKG